MTVSIRHKVIPGIVGSDLKMTPCVDEQVHMIGLTVEFDQFAAPRATAVGDDVASPDQQRNFGTIAAGHLSTDPHRPGSLAITVKITHSC